VDGELYFIVVGVIVGLDALVLFVLDVDFVLNVRHGCG
jgi:hypothetical protein